MEITDEVMHKDQSTIISIYPCEINEFKPGLYPGRFQLSPCINEDVPQFLTIGLSISLVPIPDRPPLPVETGSWRIAQAIVKDFFDSQLEHDIENNAHPGIGCLPGKVDLKEYLDKHKTFHEKLKRQQNAWAVRLVKANDNDWNRYKNHKTIRPLGIYFAKKLGFTADQKPWLADMETLVEQPKCPMCRNNVDPKAIVCTNCTPNFILNVAEYNKMKDRLVTK